MATTFPLFPVLGVKCPRCLCHYVLYCFIIDLWEANKSLSPRSSLLICPRMLCTEASGQWVIRVNHSVCSFCLSSLLERNGSASVCWVFTIGLRLKWFCFMNHKILKYSFFCCFWVISGSRLLWFLHLNYMITGQTLSFLSADILPRVWCSWVRHPRCVKYENIF